MKRFEISITSPQTINVVVMAETAELAYDLTQRVIDQGIDEERFDKYAQYDSMLVDVVGEIDESVQHLYSLGDLAVK